MNAPLILPPRLDSAATTRLAETLRAAAGKPLTMDGSGVVFGGALGLQALAAARRDWAAAGLEFRLKEPSGALEEACRILGIVPEDIGITGTEEDAA